MAQQNIPIIFQEKMNICQLGINSNDVKFGSVTLESSKYLCAKNTSGEKKSLNVIELDTRATSQFPFGGDSAIMNPISKIIGLRAGQKLQIFNIDLKSKMKNVDMPSNDDVKFWTWINPKVIGIVTNNSVYHWSIDGDAKPKKMFDRHASLQGCQIIKYKASSNGEWLVVIGIKKGNSGIDGAMQLYSTKRKVSQPLAGHSGTFIDATVNNESTPRTLFSFCEKKENNNPRLFIMEVGFDKSSGGQPFKLQPQNVPFPQQAIQQGDFPVSLTGSAKHQMLFLITRMGYLYMFDVHTGQMIYCNRISMETVFASAEDPSNGGVLGVTAKKGSVLSICVDENNLVPYIQNTMNNPQLALAISSRLGLAGGEGLFKEQFERLMQARNYDGAAKLAAKSPGNTLRNMDTIKRFQALPQVQGQPQPALKYFSSLLEIGKLNAVESVELVKPVLQQNKKQLLEKWLKEDKLECSEQLGDMIMQFQDPKMALAVYLRANATEKVINCFMQTGDYENIIKYANKVGFRPDYPMMLQHMVRQNPKGAESFAKRLANNEGGALIDVNAAVDVFMQMSRIQECTSFLLDVLKGNKPEEAALQTKLLELNLRGGAPQVADAILGTNMFSHYDRELIAQLCERTQLFQQALSHYTELADIQRVVVYTQQINADFLVTFFGTLTPENAIECIKTLLKHNMALNKQVVVQIATKYNEQLGAENLIKCFEDFNFFEGMFYYLGAVVNNSQDPEVHYRYIQAAAKMNQFREVERVCRDSKVYDADKVKDFLMEAKLQDPRPLIHVCDRHGYVPELTTYLYSNNLQKYIQVYVEKVSPAKTPAVIGKLLDLDCNEDFIRGLLNNVRTQCPVDELVDEVEQRNRLRLLQPWLEARIAEGNTEAATHNAIGKLYIRLNKDPQQFLLHNQFYDSIVVGKFCEKLDPYLAYLAYKRAWGKCDAELIEVTNVNGLFKDQARYLVERQDFDLWKQVLDDSNEYKRQLIDEVVGTALPENENADALGATVKAFMDASLPNELIELLEKIILQGHTDFATNENLQNLLILTAIKADAQRVSGYIERLDNFNGPAIAKIARSEEYELFEEAFQIYKKFNLDEDAVDVLLFQIKNLERGFEYAERVDKSDVWTKLAKAQLDQRMTHDAITSYVKANDATNFVEVIKTCKDENNYEDLVTYLTMARTAVKEKEVDTELIFSYAKTGMLTELESFISTPNIADIQSVGDRCFGESMFEAGKVLFKSISNFAMLSSCHINLEEFREAVDAAKKANSVRTWKEVNAACVNSGKFELGAIAGLAIIVNPDHLEEVVYLYERLGHFDNIVELLEQGLGAEQAHTGIYTELGCLYSKYRPEKLMEHIKIFWSKCTIPKLLRACEGGHHWAEACFLQQENQDFDSATRTMMEHSPEAFEHDKFISNIQKVRNQDLYYSAIDFYLKEDPKNLGKLMKILQSKLDHTRVTHQIRKHKQLAIIMPYLKAVQKENLTAVNEAINEMYVNDEDFDSLRTSIDSFDNLDQIGLAQKIEKHDLIEFRRIAAYLYKCNKRYPQSIALSKEDKMYKDAIDTASDSGDSKIAEELLEFFVDVGDKPCFAATLFTCNKLIRPEVVMEYAWKNGLMDFAMPFLIQFISDANNKLKEIDERTKPKDEGNEEMVNQQMMESQMYGQGMLALPDQGMGMGMMPGQMGQMGGMPQGNMGGMPGQGMGMGMPGQMPTGNMGMNNNMGGMPNMNGGMMPNGSMGGF